MRRTKLIWFAAGLFVATVVNLVALWLRENSDRHSENQYMVVSDRQDYPEGVPFPKQQIAESNPKILRECGVKSFVVWQSENWVADGEGVTSGFTPLDQSDASVTCVLGAIADGKLYGRLESAAHPNNLAPEIIQARKQKAALNNAQTH